MRFTYSQNSLEIEHFLQVNVFKKYREQSSLLQQDNTHIH